MAEHRFRFNVEQPNTRTGFDITATIDVPAPEASNGLMMVYFDGTPVATRWPNHGTATELIALFRRLGAEEATDG